MEEQQVQYLNKKQRRELRRQEKLRLRQERMRRQKYRRMALWGLVLSVGAIAIIGIVKTSPGSQFASLSSTVSTIKITESDWIKGNKTASTTLVEYSDFQCPACGAYYPFVKQLAEELGDDIRIVYRHFPLKSIHRNAELAARAAEAAGRQGKFWEMHDLIFERQEKWSSSSGAEDIFIQYAKDLNLDADQFKSDLNSAELKAKVENDLKRGIALGVNATPTFFLDGKKINRLPRSYEKFKEIILQAVSAKQTTSVNRPNPAKQATSTDQSGTANQKNSAAAE